MNTFSMKNVLKKNVMTIALFASYFLFAILALVLKNIDMFDPSIVTSLIEQNAYVYILGSGMLMCMLTGGNIDLSVGSVVCFIGAVVGLFSLENKIIKMPLSTPMVLLIAIGIGVAYGAILGFLIAYVRIPPWIATLAGYLAFRGLGTQILTTASDTSAISLPKFDGQLDLFDIFAGRLFETDWGVLNIPCVAIGVLGAALVVFISLYSRSSKIKKGYKADPKWFVILKSCLISAVILFFTLKFALDGGMPVVVLWILAVLIIYGIITEKTTIGRHFMTVGGNAEASRLSGINNKRVMFFAYLNMAVLTVIAALIVTVRTGAANSFAGQEYELDAIAACIVGGVSAYGGAGTIVGMVIGATLIGVINQGMFLIGVDQNWVKITKGLVLLAAVVFEILSKQGKKAKKEVKPKKVNAEAEGEAEAEPAAEEASALEETVVSEETEAAPVPDAGLATNET